MLSQMAFNQSVINSTFDEEIRFINHWMGQGKYDEAYDLFYRASWDYSFHAASYYRLAQISCVKKDFFVVSKQRFHCFHDLTSFLIRNTSYLYILLCMSYVPTSSTNMSVVRMTSS